MKYNMILLISGLTLYINNGLICDHNNPCLFYTELANIRYINFFSNGIADHMILNTQSVSTANIKPICNRCYDYVLAFYSYLINCNFIKGEIYVNNILSDIYIPVIKTTNNTHRFITTIVKYYKSKYKAYTELNSILCIFKSTIDSTFKYTFGLILTNSNSELLFAETFTFSDWFGFNYQIQELSEPIIKNLCNIINAKSTNNNDHYEIISILNQYFICTNYKFNNKINLFHIKNIETYCNTILKSKGKLHKIYIKIMIIGIAIFIMYNLLLTLYNKISDKIYNKT